MYDNDFSDVAQKTAFETGLFGLQLSSTEIVSPEFTSEGTAPKCWVKNNGTIYLYKAGFSGASNLGREPYSEYISSKIAHQLVGDKSIRYDLEMLKGKLCSKCELFTSQEIGYIPFYKYVDANRHYSIMDVMKICADMGYEEDCRKMFLIDSLVFNQDRHLGNFGFFVNNDTFDIIDFAPVFDYNLSMLCSAMPSDISSINDFLKYEKTYGCEHKLGGRFSEVGKAIINDAIREQLPKEIVFPVHDEYNMDADRLNKIMDIFEYHIATIIGANNMSVIFENESYGLNNHR